MAELIVGRRALAEREAELGQHLGDQRDHRGHIVGANRANLDHGFGDSSYWDAGNRSVTIRSVPVLGAQTYAWPASSVVTQCASSAASTVSSVESLPSLATPRIVSVALSPPGT